MADLFEAAHTVWEEGLNLAAAIAVILAIAKLWDLWTGHKLIRELHDDIHQIKEALNIWDDGSARTANTGRKSSSTSWQSLWAKSTAVRIAHKLKKWRDKTLKNINKAIIIPLLSAIAMFIKEVWGVEVPEDTINFAAEVILYAIFFLGIFMNPKKKEKPDLKEME